MKIWKRIKKRGKETRENIKKQEKGDGGKILQQKQKWGKNIKGTIKKNTKIWTRIKKRGEQTQKEGE